MKPSYPLYDFFKGIQALFEDFLFLPLDYIRHWENQTWFGANLLNWVFLIIFFILFGYWLYKLKVFYDYDQENTPETHR